MYTSVDECRRVTKQVQTSVDELLNEFRRVQKSHWTSVDKSLDECRQMQTSVDDSKIFSLVPEVTHGPILLLFQLCNSRPYQYANFQFCSFIYDYCSSQCSHSSHQQNSFALLFHLTYVNSNLIDAQKTSKGKREVPLRGGWTPPPKNPKIY